MLKKILLRNLFMLIGLAFYSGALAQGVTTAAINGIVTDAAGEALPGATVIAVHTPSGTQYGTATRQDGRYTFPNVRTGGPYTITVSFVGYQEQKLEGINLALGQNFTADVTLQDEATQLTAVEVTAQRNSILNSERTGAATNISTEQISALPTISRGIQDFTRLTPQSSGSNSFGGRDGRFNNLTIDGSIFNNTFGLADVPAGQTGAQPISLDAIQEVQVNLAPYDVRQGGFTGAGINAITRSGTNEFSGSAYYFLRNESLVGKTANGTDVPSDKFSVNQYGFRLGGPIIKNKLFFFVNTELERRESPATNYLALTPDRNPNDPNVTRVLASDLDQLSTFLRENYGYETGGYEGYNFNPYSNKLLARLDWNINEKNNLSLRFNYLRSFTEVLLSNSTSSGSRRSTIDALNFRNSNYEINNDIYSIIGEFNSTISNKFSNNLIFGFTANRDYRSSQSSDFPLVDILGPDERTYTTFGYEPFTANNLLNTDTWQLSDNLTYYAGAHTITAGFNMEYFRFENVFFPFKNGYYRFASLQDFYDSALGTDIDPETPGVQVRQPVYFRQVYSALPGRAAPVQASEFLQTGIYLQDAWEATRNLKLTGGLRIDIPTYPFTPLNNPVVEELTFRDEEGNPEQFSTSRLPEAAVLWSPRLGFNWDVFGNRSTQVRGGTGIFTGRIPFVWISNQVGNNGVLTGLTFEEEEKVINRGFNPDPQATLPANPQLPPTFNIAVTAENFKLPQVWRNNLAVDQQLPWGVVATLEAIYTKDVNAVYYRNANLEDPVGTFTGPDQRPIFPGSTTDRRINDNITDAIVLDNTSEGYALSLTAQLQKTFSNGLYAMAAYNYGQAKNFSPAGSIAFSSWADNQTVYGPNRPELAYAADDQRHRIISSISYRKEYAKFLGTQVSIFYEARNQGRYSYTYSGDMNRDGLSGNDLIYVPRNASEINFEEYTNRDVTYTVAQQQAALEAYINQDKYLSSRRGQYVERNGGVRPWIGRMDLSIIQDFFVNVGGKRNTLQLRADIFNFGNLINDKWGVFENQNISQLLTARGVNDAGEPVYRLNLVQGALPTTTFRSSANINDVWQAQLGVRYIFN